MIGERIKAIRKSLKLSQTAFGEKMGVGLGVIRNIEYNLVEPSELTLNHMCSIYGIRREWIETGEGEMFVERPASTLPAELTESPIIRAMLEAYLDLTPDNRKVFEQFFQNVVERCAAAAADDPLPGDVVLNAARATEIPADESHTG